MGGPYLARFSRDVGFHSSTPAIQRLSPSLGNGCRGERYPPLCHPERSRGTCCAPFPTQDLSWKCFSTERSGATAISLPKQVEDARPDKRSGQERQQQNGERQHTKPAMLAVQAWEVGNMGMAHCR